MERQGTTFWLNKEDGKETDRLMQVAEDVESGKMDMADVGDDGILTIWMFFVCLFVLGFFI